MSNNSQKPVEEDSPGHPGFSRLSILRTIWKRRILISIAWLGFSLCAVGIVHMLPVAYLAEAVVLIDSQKIPEKFVSATVANELEDRIASIRQMLLSGGELKKVIEDFGLYKEERKRHFEEEILEMMRKDITISLDSALPGSTGGTSGNSRTKRPGAFRIGYQGSDPALVMRVANRLTDLYVEQNLKNREGQASGTSDFLETQVKDAKKHLDEMEAAVSAYKLSHNGELPQQEHTLSGTLTRLQTELEANRDAMNRASQTKTIMESSVNAMETTLSSQVRAWEQSLNPDEPSYPGAPLRSAQSAPTPRAKASETMEEQLALLVGRYSENHPEIVRLRGDIEKMKRIEEQRQKTEDQRRKASADLAAAAEVQPPSAGKPSSKQALREPPEFAHTRQQISVLKAQIKGADNELANRKTEQARILRDLGMYQGRIEKLPVREQEMSQITRDYEISKINYKSLLDKKMDAEMSLNMERRQQSERFVVLDRAQLPEKPVKPNRPMLYGAGTAAGLALALLLGFVAELRSNVMLGEWELPPGTPVLARLPFIEIGAGSAAERPKPRGWFSRRKEIVNATVALFLHRM